MSPRCWDGHPVISEDSTATSIPYMGRKSNQAVRAAMLVFIGLDFGNAGPVTSHAGDEHGFCRWV